MLLLFSEAFIIGVKSLKNSYHLRVNKNSIQSKKNNPNSVTFTLYLKFFN